MFIPDRITGFLENFANYITEGNPVTVKGQTFDETNYMSEMLIDIGSATNMNVNGSVINVEYRYTVPANKTVKLTRGFIAIEDGNTAFSPGNFGAIAGPLANGLEASVTSGAVTTVLENWTTNREIRVSMFDFDTQFKTDGAYAGRWTFSKDLADGGFTLTAGDRFSFTVKDDLTGLDHLSFKIKGLIQDA